LSDVSQLSVAHEYTISRIILHVACYWIGHWIKHSLDMWITVRTTVTLHTVQAFTSRGTVYVHSDVSYAHTHSSSKILTGGAELTREHRSVVSFMHEEASR